MNIKFKGTVAELREHLYQLAYKFGRYHEEWDEYEENN